MPCAPRLCDIVCQIGPKFFGGLPQRCVICFSQSKYKIMRPKYNSYDRQKIYMGRSRICGDKKRFQDFVKRWFGDSTLYNNLLSCAITHTFPITDTTMFQITFIRQPLERYEIDVVMTLNATRCKHTYHGCMALAFIQSSPSIFCSLNQGPAIKGI